MRLKPLNFFPSDVQASRAARGQSVATPPAPDHDPDKSAVLTRVVFPPWLYPLASGNDFFKVNVFTTPNVQTGALAKVAVLPAGANQTIFSEPVVIPDGMKGVVRVVSIFVDAPTAVPAIDVNYVLRINGGPVQGWTFATFPRTAANLSIDFGGVVRLPQAAVVDVAIINNNANGPWTVGVQVGGWYYSVREATRLYGDIY